MRRRISAGWPGAVCLFIALLGSACGLVVGSETIGSEPLGEGGKAGSGGGGIGGMGGMGGTGANGGMGGGGGGGGNGGAGGGSCDPVPEACSACLSCGPVEMVEFTSPGTKFFPAAKTQGIGAVAPEPKFGCIKADGPERVYAVTYNDASGTTPTAFLTASLNRFSTQFNSVLYAKKNCCAGPTELCSDSTGGPAMLGGEVLSLPISSGETLYIFVDGADAAAAGSYEITLNLSYGFGCESNQFYIPIPLELGGPITLKGTTDIEDENNGCGSPGFGWIGWGSSAVYELSWADDVKSVDIKLKNTDASEANDTLFYLRTTCETQGGAEGTPDSELACVDNNDATDETYSLSLAGKTPPIFLFADVGQGEGGPFELTLTPK